MRALLIAALLVPSIALSQSGPIAREVQKVTVNGYPLAYVAEGSGPPVVLVHGSSSDYRVWGAQLNGLAPRFRVYALSLRHYYPEKWDGQGAMFTVEQHAKDVIAFIEQLNAGKVHLVAHSRGGNVGLHVAKWRPDILRSAVFMDASGLEGLLPDTPEDRAEATAGTEARKKFGEQVRTGQAEQALADYAAFTTGPGTWEKLPEANRQIRRDNLWTVVGDSARPQTTCEEGQKITVPVLLMNGEVSPKRFSRMFDAFEKCLPNRARVTIEGASHNMRRTHSEVVNRALIDFFSKS